MYDDRQAAEDPATTLLETIAGGGCRIGAGVTWDDERKGALVRQLEVHPELMSARYGLRMGTSSPGAVGGTILHVAVRARSGDAVRILLEHGADPNATDADGATPLTGVALSYESYGRIGGDMGVPEMLVAGGADVNARDNEGRTALYWVLSYSSNQGYDDRNSAARIAKWLIANGADVNIQWNSGQCPAGIVRSTAFRTEQPELLALVEEQRELAGSVCAAAVQGDLLALSRLLDQGGDANERDHDGNAALHGAVRGGHVDVVRQLVARGAHLDAVDSSGWTPLHSAVWQGDVETTRCLLDAGADTRIRESLRGMTAGDMATERGNSQVASLLARKVEPSKGQTEARVEKPEPKVVERKPWWRFG